MDRFTRIAIPAMFAGLILALLYAVFSASSKGSNRDPVAKFATGELADLDTSERGLPAPTAPFTVLDGSETTLQAYEGQVLVVNFWATWCAPCEKEMPSLAALQTARGGDDFKVIAISVDAEEDRDYAVQRLATLSGGVLDFYHAAPVAWDIVYDSGARRGFPTTVIYDETGTKIAQLAGDADWASYEAIGLIDAILDR
ncbi:MAG: TlpA disulfide reductase family protein [Henriciella sp.]|nr:TlpA disulfide reductase family protein [Henriciella sp.]